MVDEAYKKAEEEAMAEAEKQASDTRNRVKSLGLKLLGIVRKWQVEPGRKQNHGWR